MARSIAASSMNILAGLISRPLYGYAIRKEVLARTNGEVDLTFGTLYEQIGSLLRQGYIELDHEEVSPGGKRRKFYRITASGQAAYNLQLTAWVRRAQTLQSAGVRA